MVLMTEFGTDEGEVGRCAVEVWAMAVLGLMMCVMKAVTMVVAIMDEIPAVVNAAAFIGSDIGSGACGSDALTKF